MVERTLRRRGGWGGSGSDCCAHVSRARRGMVVAVVVFLAGARVEGGTVVGFVSASGPGMGDAFETLIESLDGANNDNTDFSLNLMWLDAIFDHTRSIDMVLDVDDSFGVTEYAVSLFPSNLTRDTWVGYRVRLGFWEGDDFVDAGGSGLDFDAPNVDPGPVFIEGFDTFAHGTTLLQWHGGGVASGFGPIIDLNLDVPDSALAPEGVKTDDGYRFTIRQTPLLLGDLDGDGVLNNFDIDEFEAALADPVLFAAGHPDSDPLVVGDMDRDGVFDNFDIDDFEVMLVTPGAVPEPGAGVMLMVFCAVMLRRGRRRRTVR